LSLIQEGDFVEILPVIFANGGIQLL